MPDEKIDLPDGRVMVVIAKPFMYNGNLLKVGDKVEMNRNRAVNHMRVGDVERDDVLIAEVKQVRVDAAEAAKADAQGEW